MQPFAFAEAHSLQAALDLAAQGAMPIAGGTDLIQLLQENVMAPATLVGIGRLPFAGIQSDTGRTERGGTEASGTEDGEARGGEPGGGVRLGGVRIGGEAGGGEPGGGVRIGAMAHLAAVADDSRIQADHPLVAQALMETASPQVRNMATIGGNLLQRTRCLYFRDCSVPCNKRQPGSGCSAQEGHHRINAIFGGSAACFAAYPGDLAVALVALDASLEVRGPQGPRHLKIADLHRPPGDTPQIETSLRPGEIIVAIRIPANPFAAHSHFLKVRDRASFEWALVSVAAALDLDGGTVRAARIAAGGVGTTPWRLPQVEARLTGQALDRHAAHAAGQAAAQGAEPRAGNAFKVTLLQNAVERAVLTAGGLL